MKLRIIAAVDFNGAIGSKGAIPWRAPADMARFRRLTMGHALLLGRKTYQSLPKKLDGRELLVLTRDGHTPLPLGGTLVFNLGQILVGWGNRLPEIFVGGGADVYRLCLPTASHLELTVVHVQAPEADVYFPPFDAKAWKVKERVERAADAQNPQMTFLTLERQRMDTSQETEPKPPVNFWKEWLLAT